MLSFLKNHPFAVEAFFETSLVLTFAVPKEELEHLVPDHHRRGGHHRQGLWRQEQGPRREPRRPRSFARLISVTDIDVAAYERDGVVCLRGAFDAG